MSINIQKKQIRIRMDEYQFISLKNDSYFEEHLSEQENLFSYSVVLTSNLVPNIEFTLNKIKIFLPNNIINQLSLNNQKVGVTYNLPKEISLMIQVDIMRR